MNIEKRNGREAAIQRNIIYNFYGTMKDKIAEKSGIEPGIAIIARQKAINKAAGIESIKTCPPAKYGTVIICVNAVINAYEISDAKARSLFIKEALGKIAEMEAAISRLFGAHKKEEAKAA